MALHILGFPFKCLRHTLFFDENRTTNSGNAGYIKFPVGSSNDKGVRHARQVKWRGF